MPYFNGISSSQVIRLIRHALRICRQSISTSSLYFRLGIACVAGARKGKRGKLGARETRGAFLARPIFPSPFPSLAPATQARLGTNYHDPMKRVMNSLACDRVRRSSSTFCQLDHANFEFERRISNSICGGICGC